MDAAKITIFLLFANKLITFFLLTLSIAMYSTKSKVASRSPSCMVQQFFFRYPAHAYRLRRDRYKALPSFEYASRSNEIAR